jgi:hypothetical protein
MIFTGAQPMADARRVRQESRCEFSAPQLLGVRRGGDGVGALRLFLPLVSRRGGWIALVNRFQAFQIVFQIIAEAHGFDSGEIFRKCSKE